MRYEFDWDPAKAVSNLADHRVSFDEAMTVFVDPLALSIPDDDNRDIEERWVTIGVSRTARLVVHTHAEIATDTVYIRIISARGPTKTEVRHYEEGFDA